MLTGKKILKLLLAWLVISLSFGVASAQKLSEEELKAKAEAAAFYEQFGFAAVDDATCNELGNINVEKTSLKQKGLSARAQTTLAPVFRIFNNADKQLDKARLAMAEIAENKASSEKLVAKITEWEDNKARDYSSRIDKAKSDIEDFKVENESLQEDIQKFTIRAKEIKTAALRPLMKILEEEKLRGSERAIAWNYMASIYFDNEDFEGILTSLEGLLAEPESQPVHRRPALLTVAQILLANENFVKADTRLTEWFKLTKELGEKLKPDNYFLRAQLKYQLGQPDEAIKEAGKTVQLAQCLQEFPQESWMRLLTGLNLQKEAYEEAYLPNLVLVLRFPKRSYWVQLQEIFRATEREEQQAIVLKLAWHLGLLEKSREYVGLAQSLLQNGSIVEAIAVLEEGFDKEIIEDKLSNVSLMAVTLRRAAELEKAIPWYERAAKMASEEDDIAKSERYSISAASMAFQTEQYEKSKDIYEKIYDLDKKVPSLNTVLGLAQVMEVTDGAEPALKVLNDYIKSLELEDEEELPTQLKSMVSYFETHLETVRGHREFLKVRQQQINALKRDLEQAQYN